LKPHWSYSYSEGDVGHVTAEAAPKLLKGGFILPLPEEEKEKVTPKEVVNPLPEDFPSREVLFANGFDSVGKINEGGDSLSDILNKTALKKVKKYLEEKFEFGK
jgi:hypothetical protein